MAIQSNGIKLYEFNESRPWSEFRPFITSFIVGVNLLAIGGVVWYATVKAWPSVTVFVTAAAFYVFTGFGIALGYHRLFTHESYKCKPWFKAVLLIAGGLSGQGDILGWLKTHKRHHAYADRPGDAHSPYQYGGTKWLTLKGIMWAHVGWLFYEYPIPERERPDKFDRDRMFQLQTRYYPWLLVGTFVLPAVICGVVGLATGGLDGFWTEALDGLLFAGVMRVALFLNVTWCVNSVCHLWGEQLAISVTRPNGAREFFPSDGSRNALGLATLSFGESKHALHHLFPYIAFMAWDKWGVDPSKWVLLLMERFGVVWNIQEPPPFEKLPLKVELPEDSFIADAQRAKFQLAA